MKIGKPLQVREGRLQNRTGFMQHAQFFLRFMFKRKERQVLAKNATLFCSQPLIANLCGNFALCGLFLMLLSLHHLFNKWCFCLNLCIEI